MTEMGGGHNWKAICWGLPLLGFLLVFPFLVDSEGSYLVYFLFLTFIYVSMAQGWNLVAGYAGQASLGQHAFFGFGAYVTAMAWNAGWIGYLDPFGMLLSGLGAAVLAIVIGIPLLAKLRGGLFCFGHPGSGGNFAGGVYPGGGSYGRSGGTHAPFFGI